MTALVILHATNYAATTASVTLALLLTAALVVGTWLQWRIR